MRNHKFFFKKTVRVKEDSFLKVLLDHFAPNLYYSYNNPVFEPAYTICINRNLCPGDNRYSIELKSFSSMNAIMLNCLIQTETVCLCGFIQTVSSCCPSSTRV